MQDWLTTAAASTPWPSLEYQHLLTVDSTNRYVGDAGAQNGRPLLVTAQEQREGKGRAGRSWYSDSGASLVCSLGVPLAPKNWEGLALLVGLSLAQSLHPNVKVKWPNDLWWAGKKFAGILIQTTPLPRVPSVSAMTNGRYVVIGFGVNLSAVPNATQKQLGHAAACCEDFLPKAQCSADAVLRLVVPDLLKNLGIFEQQGFAPFRHAFASCNALLNQVVTTHTGSPDTDVEGKVLGVNEVGGLEIQSSEGKIHVFSGLEVSVRV